MPVENHAFLSHCLDSGALDGMATSLPKLQRNVSSCELKQSVEVCEILAGHQNPERFPAQEPKNRMVSDMTEASQNSRLKKLFEVLALLMNSNLLSRSSSPSILMCLLSVLGS